MIKVQYSKKDDVEKILVSGHAMFGEFGNDIVCAATSMLVFTIANQILKIDSKFEVKVEENDITFINKCNNSDINLLIDTMKTGFDMLIEEYDEYINVSSGS